MSSITLSAKLSHAKVALGKGREAHLLVALKGAKAQGERKPLRLSVAIDVSGSMAGEKIEQAKRSLQRLIEHLSEGDSLAIVAFSTTVWTVFEPARMTREAKDRASRQVEGLRSTSSTNLSGATLEAYSLLKEARDRADAVVRAFLFTDGRPTEGVQDHRELVAIAGRRPEGAGLTCFGYGGDHDPELLDSMSRAGGGNFYYVRTPDECPAFFGRELGGLLSCVAQSVKLTVRTKQDVKILEVLNDLDVKASDDRTEAVVSVDDVYGQETRRVLLRLELPAMEKSGRPFRLGEVKVEFQDLLAKEPRTEEAAVFVEYVKEEDADREADKEVAEQVAVMEAAKAQEEAVRLAKAGHYDRAKSVVRTAALGCHALGTSFAHRVGDDLEQNVMCQLSADAFAAGGSHYLHANGVAYRRGRGTTAGAADLFDTEEQRGTAQAFSAPLPAEPARQKLTDIRQRIAPAPGAAPAPAPKERPLSKSRSRRP